jgi:hypothetical protein
MQASDHPERGLLQANVQGNRFFGGGIVALAVTIERKTLMGIHAALRDLENGTAGECNQ